MLSFSLDQPRDVVDSAGVQSEPRKFAQRPAPSSRLRRLPSTLAARRTKRLGPTPWLYIPVSLTVPLETVTRTNPLLSKRCSPCSLQRRPSPEPRMRIPGKAKPSLSWTAKLPSLPGREKYPGIAAAIRSALAHAEALQLQVHFVWVPSRWKLADWSE